MLKVGLFLSGLFSGFVGFLVWIIASVVEGVIQGTTGESTGLMLLVYLGALVMVGGPAYFWLLVPAVRLVRRLRR